jgi:hypothetical protein
MRRVPHPRSLQTASQGGAGRPPETIDASERAPKQRRPRGSGRQATILAIAERAAPRTAAYPVPSDHRVRTWPLAVVAPPSDRSHPGRAGTRD